MTTTRSEKKSRCFNYLKYFNFLFLKSETKLLFICNKLIFSLNIYFWKIYYQINRVDCLYVQKDKSAKHSKNKMKTKYKFEDLFSTVQKMTWCFGNFDRNKIVKTAWESLALNTVFRSNLLQNYLSFIKWPSCFYFLISMKKCLMIKSGSFARNQSRLRTEVQSDDRPPWNHS